MKSVETSIGNISELKYGKALKQEHRKGGKYPVYGSSGIVGYHDEALMDKPTLIIGRKGSIGEIYYSEKPCWIIDTAYYLDYNSNQVDLKWFKEMLISLNLKKLNQAAAVPGLNRNDVYNLKINLPPLSDLRHIANILSKAEALIAQRKQSIALLDELLKSTFLEMFGDTTKFDLLRIEDIASKNKYSLSSGPFGSNLTSKDYTSEGVIILRGTNITSGKLDLSEVKYISEDKAIELKRSEIRPNDIVIVAVGASGKALKIPNSLKRAIMSQNFNKITPDSTKINPTYFEYCINSEIVQNQFKRDITDTVRTFLSLTKIKEVKIPTPHLKYQTQFAQIVEKTKALKTHYQQSLQELEKLYGSLSQRAFKGELNIKEEALLMAAEPEVKYKSRKKGGSSKKLLKMR